MKLENLNRAKDLLTMKNEALKLLNANTKALTYMKKYTWDSGHYPFSYDMTRQVGGSPTSETKFIKTITIKSAALTADEIYCTIPLDLLIKATQEEINRLNARIEEIEKEVETL